MIEVPVKPADALEEPWHGLYVRAWEDLRFDRFYGAMGGEGPISYLAISQYGRDLALSAEAFEFFKIFVRALDAEWLDYVIEQSKSGG